MSLYDNPKVAYWLRDPFWGAINYATYYALRSLPTRTASDIGGLLGRAAGRLRFPDLSARSDRNLQLIRPDLAPEPREKIVREMWSNVGRLNAEMTVLDRLSGNAEFTINDEKLRAQVHAKRPIVLVFPHLGNWEVLTIAAQRCGVVLNVVYEELGNRFEAKLAAHARRALGYRLIAPDRVGVRNIYCALQRGEAVGIAIDEYRNGNVVAPGFGRALPANTNMQFALRLARRFGAAILPAYCVRTSALGFEMTCQDELINPEVADLNALCESWIRAHPEQWYMLHRLRLETSP